MADKNPGHLSDAGREAISRLPAPPKRGRGNVNARPPWKAGVRRGHKAFPRRALRAYLTWVRSGMQLHGQFALSVICKELDITKEDLITVMESDPKFMERTQMAVENKHRVAQLVAIEELKVRLLDESRMRVTPMREVTHAAEFLAKFTSGHYREGEGGDGHGPKVEINLNLPHVEGYDQARRMEARVKASEALGPLLTTGDEGDGNTDPTVGEG